MSLFADYYKERQAAETIEHAQGFIVFKILGEQCFLKEIYVIPSERKTYVGSLLVDAMLKKARSHGCKQMTATIFPAAQGATEALHAALHIGMRLHSVGPEFIGLSKEIE